MDTDENRMIAYAIHMHSNRSWIYTSTYRRERNSRKYES